MFIDRQNGTSPQRLQVIFHADKTTSGCSDTCPRVLIRCGFQKFSAKVHLLSSRILVRISNAEITIR